MNSFIRMQAVNVLCRLRFGVLLERQSPIQIIAELFFPSRFSPIIFVIINEVLLGDESIAVCADFIYSAVI